MLNDCCKLSLKVLTMPQMHPSNYEDQPEGAMDNVSEASNDVSSQMEGFSSLNQLLLVENGTKVPTQMQNVDLELAPQGETICAFAIPKNTIDHEPEVPTFAMIAEYIKKYVPWHIKTYTGKDRQDNALELIHATANVLMRADVEQWKKLCSDAPDFISDAGESIISTSSAARSNAPASRGNKVSFHIIGKEFRRLLTEKGVPNSQLPKEDRFRNGSGSIPKYFKRVLKTDKNPANLVTTKDMEKFSVIFSGFISKLYFSKVGYDSTYDQLAEDVGSFIAEQALKAASVCPLFKYKLVVPENLYIKYNLCHAISDTSSKELLKRLHTLRQGPTMDVPHVANDEQILNETTVSRPLPQLNFNDFESEGCSIPRRIEEKQARIEAYEDDNRVARETIVDNTKKIEQLKKEIESLNFLKEQQINAANLVTGMRSALNNDEVAFKEISEVVVQMVPELAKNLSQFNKDQIKNAVLNAIKSAANNFSSNAMNAKGYKQMEMATTSNKRTFESGPVAVKKSKGKGTSGKEAKSKASEFMASFNETGKELHPDNFSTCSNSSEEGVDSENESLLSTASMESGVEDNQTASKESGVEDNQTASKESGVEDNHSIEEPANKKAKRGTDQSTKEIANVDKTMDVIVGSDIRIEPANVNIKNLQMFKKVLEKNL